MTTEQWADATARIATGLLGWEDYDGYGFIDREATTLNEIISTEIFATLDGCNLFERELARRGLLNEYASWIDALTVQVPLSLTPKDEYNWRNAALILASPEQRVQACLRVMEEAGLCAPERHDATSATALKESAAE